MFVYNFFFAVVQMYRIFHDTFKLDLTSVKFCFICCIIFSLQPPSVCDGVITDVTESIPDLQPSVLPEVRLRSSAGLSVWPVPHPSHRVGVTAPLPSPRHKTRLYLGHSAQQGPPRHQVSLG